SNNDVVSAVSGPPLKSPVMIRGPGKFRVQLSNSPASITRFVEEPSSRWVAKNCTLVPSTFTVTCATERLADRNNPSVAEKGNRERIRFPSSVPLNLGTKCENQTRSVFCCNRLTKVGMIPDGTSQSLIRSALNRAIQVAVRSAFLFP